MSDSDFSKINSILSAMKNSDNTQKENTAKKMMSMLSDEEAKELTDVISDKDKINSILNSAAAQQIISKINGNKNGQHQ